MQIPVALVPPSAALRFATFTALLLLGFLTTPVLHAQGPGGDPRQMLLQRVELYTTQLSLDAGQAEQVKQILIRQMDEFRELMQKANGDFSVLREQMQPIRQATNAKIEALLTSDEQRAAFKILQEEETARRRQGIGGVR